jgi:predicted transcriptional regulator
LSTTQGIKLDNEVSERLKTLAKQRNRSPHWLMRDAISKYLEHEERYEIEKKEDMTRWENYLLTSKAIDGDKVEKWLEDLSHGKKSECPK